MAPLDLNLRHLRALETVIRHGSMRAAAEASSLSQPALTQGVAKLERQLGMILFERRPDGVRATPAGRAMAARTAVAFDRLGRAMRDAARGGTRGFSRPERLATATQLRAFLATADGGGFAGAAGLTGLSQPALHRAVRDLEQICGVALVERRGRGVQLTPAGRRLARGVRLAAGEIAAGIAEIGGNDAPAGPIVIGTMPLARARVVPRAIAAFIRDGARPAVRVVEGSWRELVEPLRDGIVDMMIGAIRHDLPADLRQRALFEDELVIVGRANHPLRAQAGGRRPSPAALRRHGWIVAAPGTPLRARWAAMFGDDLPPAPVECGSTMVMRGVLADSDLLALLSPDQVAIETAAGLLATIGPPLADGLRTIGIVTRCDWRPTAAQARFLELVEQAALPEKR